MSLALDYSLGGHDIAAICRDVNECRFNFREFEVIDQKRVRVFYQGFQTPRNGYKHDAEGRVLLLFRGDWNHR